MFTFFELIFIVGSSYVCGVMLITSRVFGLSFYVVYSAAQFSLQVQGILLALYGWTEFLFIFKYFYISTDGEFSSEDEEDFLIEYEVLSNASTEPWDGNEDLWSFRGADALPLDVVPSSGEYKAADSIVTTTTQTNVLGDNEDKSAGASSSTSTVPLVESTAEDSGDQIVVVQHSDGVERLETPTTSADVIETVEISSLEVTEKPVFKNDKEHGAEDLEKMMHEMASMRENMRNMSDGQRREMAAQLAMRMASMFLDDDEDDE